MSLAAAVVMVAAFSVFRFPLTICLELRLPLPSFAIFSLFLLALSHNVMQPVTIFLGFLPR
jgi:hypothetical protein